MSASFTKVTDISKLRKGNILRKKTRSGEYEYYVLGRFIPNIQGWEIYPYGKNLLNSDSILFYLKNEDILSNDMEFRE